MIFFYSWLLSVFGGLIMLCISIFFIGNDHWLKVPIYVVACVCTTTIIMLFDTILNVGEDAKLKKK